MDCNKVNKYLTEAYSGSADELPHEIATHIDQCTNCRQLLAVQSGIESFAKQRRNIDVDFYFTSRVLAAAEKQNSIKSDYSGLRFSKIRVAAAISVLILSVSIGVLAGRFSADIYSNQKYSTYYELSSVMSYGISDNSFDLINFDDYENDN